MSNNKGKEGDEKEFRTHIKLGILLQESHKWICLCSTRGQSLLGTMEIEETKNEGSGYDGDFVRNFAQYSRIISPK